MTSECPECPPYVIRCAHFGNQRVWLADHAGDGVCQGCMDKWHGGDAPYFVATIPTAAFRESCDTCATRIISWLTPGTDWEYVNDEPSALTEFQTRAAHLLERAQ